MIRALYTAATGMSAQQTHIDVLANNLANIRTVGFKKQRAEFSDLLYQYVRRAGAVAIEDIKYPTEIAMGTGAKLVSTNRTFSQGSLRATEEPLDWAIEGEGFFRVEGFEGEILYTRNGEFKTDLDGRILTSQGFILADNITVSEEAIGITVSPDGIVYEQLGADQDPQEIGQIQLARFVNPKGLESRGDNVFAETIASGDVREGDPGDEGFGLIRQGFLEESNVDVVVELVEMIRGQRGFEINANVIETADQMLGRVSQIRG